MNKQQKSWSDRVVLAAIFLNGFGAAHLIDDFLYGVPADFGLSEPFSQLLAILYFSLTGWLLVLAARGKTAGYTGNLALAIFLIVADMSKHGFLEGMLSGSWRAGFTSHFFALGLVAVSIWLAVVSYGARRVAG